MLLANKDLDNIHRQTTQNGVTCDRQYEACQLLDSSSWHPSLGMRHGTCYQQRRPKTTTGDSIQRDL